jgi:hypothetical protein
MKIDNEESINITYDCVHSRIGKPSKILLGLSGSKKDLEKIDALLRDLFRIETPGWPPTKEMIENKGKTK